MPAAGLCTYPSISEVVELENFLIIFAKAPIAGMVKTRLFPHLSFEEAAGLQRALLADMVAKTACLPGIRRCLAYTPERTLDMVQELCFGLPIEYGLQEGEGLGERMKRSLACAFGRGAGKAAIIGTDVPTLPPYYLCTAFVKLDEADLVIGPANDGGYYLIGMKRPIPELFDGISWSGPGVFGATMEKARSLGLTVFCLPPLQDIDTIKDLKGLLGAALPHNTRMVVAGLEPRLRAQMEWLE